MDESPRRGLFGRLTDLLSSAPQSSFVPSIERPKRKTKPPQVPQPDGPPGNFLYFDCYLELKVNDVVHIGYPAVPLRLNGVPRWSRHKRWPLLDRAQSPIPIIPWIDFNERGVGQRTIVNIEDVLGAEGMIGEHLMRFEQVLFLGNAEIDYGLYCPAKGFRTAYGFDRAIFQQGYISPGQKKLLEMDQEKT